MNNVGLLYINWYVDEPVKLYFAFLVFFYQEHWNLIENYCHSENVLTHSHVCSKYIPSK